MTTRAMLAKLFGILAAALMLVAVANKTFMLITRQKYALLLGLLAFTALFCVVVLFLKKKFGPTSATPITWRKRVLIGGLFIAASILSLIGHMTDVMTMRFSDVAFQVGLMMLGITVLLREK